VSDTSVEKLMEVVRCEQHTSYEGMLDSPFDPTEMYRAIKLGGRKKTNGNDGLGREFYSHNWAIIKDDMCEVINQMFWAGNIPQQQKRGVKVCLPKAQGNQTPEDYRTVTLLKSDYKILARIILQHLRPVLADQLTETQFCGVPGNRSLTRWQRYVIPSRMHKAGGSLYECFPLILKTLLIGSPPTTRFKHARDTALETRLSPYGEDV